jgi:allantoinase
VGRDADLVVWEPDAELRVTADSLHHRHRLSPYVGGVFSGVVRTTYVRGVRVYDGGRFTAERPAGRTLLRASR